MPLIHSIVLDSDITNSINTTSLLIAVNTYASGSPLTMAFSGDGTTFSAYQPFRITTYNYDISTNGGNSTLGRHTVYVKVRDASLLESAVVSRDIIFGEVPMAEVNKLTVRDGLVDIDYNMIDCASSLNDIIKMEYSTTGAFTGEESQCTQKSSDSTHSGTSSIKGSIAGWNNNFVWDVETDLGKVKQTVYIRTESSNESRAGDKFVFGPFTISLLEKPDSGFKMNAGDSETLKIHYADNKGIAFNPDTVEITEILDPLDVDILGGALTLVPTSVGNYEHNHTSLLANPLGKYVYTFKATVGTIEKLSSFAFELKNPLDATAVTPSTEGHSIVSGQLEDASGAPIEDVNVYFFPSDIEDESIKVDSVSDEPLTTTTDSCGRFSMELVRNKAYVLVIPILHYRKTFKTPDQPATELKDLELINLPIGPRDSLGNPTGPIYDVIDGLAPKPKC
jgi:hypothetical protein